MFVAESEDCLQVITKSTSENGSLSNRNDIYHEAHVQDFTIFVP
jgi:hypothetical protein